MAGHSHWAQIKRKKGANDAKRGKVFSKIAKKITAAAKAGGGDPDGNLRLRYAIDEARKENMPKDSIENAIKKGTGELGGANDFEELIYGGYGPNGVAILCEILTDNRNRTAPEIKKMFERRGGKFDDSGSTVYKFEQKGVIYIKKDAITEEALLELVLEAGADEIIGDDPDVWEIHAPVETFRPVREAVEAAEIPMEDASISRLPSLEIELDVDASGKVMRLIDELEEHDDVGNVYTDAKFAEAFESVE